MPHAVVTWNNETRVVTNGSMKLLVGMTAVLALAPGCFAEIVYSGPLSVNTLNHRFGPGPSDPPYVIDFNSDGRSDLEFINTGRISSYTANVRFTEARFAVTSDDLPRPYEAGELIAENASWVYSNELWGTTRWITPSFNFDSATGTYLRNSGRKFLGARLTQDGAAHFGWVELETLIPYEPWQIGQFPVQNFGYAVIHGWAYETAPNAPIIAGALPAAVPEPSAYALAVWALAAFLAASRRFITKAM